MQGFIKHSLIDQCCKICDRGSIIHIKKGFPMEYSLIKVEVENHIAIVEMNRKKELNALNMTILKELDNAFSSFTKEDSDINLVVLTGGDECFSAGLDLKEVPDLNEEDSAKYFKYAHDLYVRLIEYEKILITAVSGIAFGGGLNLALMGDIIIASESAIFGHPEVKYGFNPLITPLVSRIGMARSKELTLRGDPIGAIQAYNIGLINRVIPPERFREEVSLWARQLAKRPKDAVAALKRSFDVVSRLDSNAAIEYELEITAMLLNVRTSVRREMRQFIQGKKSTT
jgi:enoyl-CoA hydratase/carnithine racemase